MHILEKYLVDVQCRKDRPPALADIRKIFQIMTYEIPFTQKHALTVNDLQIRIFFNLLDVDGSGFLEPEEFVDLISSRKSFGTSQDNKPQINELTEGLKKVANDIMKALGFVPYFRPKEVSTKKSYSDNVEHD